jgi:hypothetical protein
VTLSVSNRVQYNDTQCKQSFMLSVAMKSIMLSVIMLTAVAPERILGAHFIDIKRYFYTLSPIEKD